MKNTTLAEIREILAIQAELLRRLSDLLGKLEKESEEGKGEAEGLTLQEASRKIGVSYPTLWRLIKSGKVQAKRVGKRWIVPVSELERLLSLS